MIELRVRPVLRIMAGRAFPAVPPMVVIVILVAGITIRVRLFHFDRFIMAVVAFNFSVSTPKWEIGVLGMVKS
jgi:hypothetical protein